ncbi:MAG TPA: hypothetical protein VGG19_04045 [Tepidisphaeraceae bacterium]|jgi:hypothetical protein
MKAENDEQVLQIVSDALRDGPGSPAWQEATQLIDATDGQELDALYRVRQRLESGKRWRQVRPGVGFTRKVMEAVDHQSDATVRSTGPATIIAILCGLLIVIILAALVPMLFSPAKAPQQNTTDFDNIYFSTPWLTSDFADSIGGEWNVTGNNPVAASHGLHAKLPNRQDTQWAIVSAQSLNPDQFFSFTTRLDIPTDGTIAQVFITDQKNQLAAVINATNVQIMLPGNQLETTLPRPTDPALQVRWLIGPASAALEINNHRAWAGSNNLTSNQPRSIGIRFLITPHTGTAAGIENVDVRTKS